MGIRMGQYLGKREMGGGREREREINRFRGLLYFSPSLFLCLPASFSECLSTCVVSECLSACLTGTSQTPVISVVALTAKAQGSQSGTFRQEMGGDLKGDWLCQYFGIKRVSGTATERAAQIEVNRTASSSTGFL